MITQLLLILLVALTAFSAHAQKVVRGPGTLTTYIFGMSEGRELVYSFGERADLPGRGDVLRTRVDGKVVSEWSATNLELVMVPSTLTTIEMAQLKASLRPGLKFLWADPRTNLIISTNADRSQRARDRGGEYSMTRVNEFLRDESLEGKSGQLKFQYLNLVDNPNSKLFEHVWDFASYDELSVAAKIDATGAYSEVRRTFEDFARRTGQPTSAPKAIRPPTPPAAVKTRKLKGGFAKFDEALNEVTGQSSPKFIVPNEFNNEIQFTKRPRNLPGKNAVVAVGTMRAFNLAGALKRDILVALDYSSEIVNANKILVDLIATSDRQTFVKEVLGMAQSQGSVRTSKDFRNLALTALNLNVPRFENSHAAALAKLLPAPPPGMHGQSMWRMWLMAMTGYTSSEETWKTAFFSNDEAYNHVRKMIQNGNVWIVQGSLAGDKSMKAVGEKLRAQGAEVSELDVSNALEHVVNYLGPQGLKTFAKNSAALPQNSDSALLLTLDARSDLSPKQQARAIDGWIYSEKRLRAFTEELQTTITKKYSNASLNKSVLTPATAKVARTCESMFH